MVVFAHGEGLAHDAQDGEAREGSADGVVHERIGSDKPVVMIPFAMGEGRVIPIGVDIAVIELRLIVPESVLQLRAGRELLSAEALDVVVHFLPIAVFDIVEEGGEIVDSVGSVETRRAFLSAQERNGGVFEVFRLEEADISAFAHGEVGDFEGVPFAARAEGDSRHIVVKFRHEGEGERLPFLLELQVFVETERGPRIMVLFDAKPDSHRLVGARLKGDLIGSLVLDFDGDAVELRSPRDFPALLDFEAQRGRVDPRLGGLEDAIGLLRGRVGFENPTVVLAECESFAEDAVVEEFVAERIIFAFPRFAQRGGRLVLLLEPFVPERFEFARVRLRQIVELSPRPARNDRVLVIDLNHRHARIVDVRLTRIGIDVREQILRVFLLENDHRAVEVVDALAVGRELVGVLQPVDFAETAGDVQVDIDVDSALLEAANKVIELFELVRVNLRRPLAHIFAPDHGAVHMMETHDADSEAGEGIGESFGLLMGTEVGAEAQVRSQESLLPEGADEGAVLRGQEAFGARRREVGAIPRSHVGNRVGSALFDNKWKVGIRAVGGKRGGAEGRHNARRQDRR